MTRRRVLTDAEAAELRTLIEVRRNVAREMSDKVLSARFGCSPSTLKAYARQVHKTRA